MKWEKDMLLFRLFSGNYEFVQIVLIMLAYVSAILLTISVHDYVEARVAVKHGDITPKILGRYTLAPFAHVDLFGFICLVLLGFGWSKPLPINMLNFKNGRKSQRTIYGLGILSNLVFGVIAALLYVLFSRFMPGIVLETQYGQACCLFLYYLSIINFVFAFFHLLPLYAFEGYKILEASLKPDSNFMLFMRKYSFIILLVLIFTGIIEMYVQYVPFKLAELSMEGFNELINLIVG